MSVLDNGFSPSFFTRGRAVLAGLAIGVALLIGNELFGKALYYVSEPTTAPICFGPAQPGGRKPMPGDLRNSSGQMIDDRPAGQDIARVMTAMAACTLQSCPREALKAYRSAMFWYMTTRTQHMTHLYRDYGDAGLTRARQIYRQSADIDIVDGLRKRYAASIVRLNDFKQHQAAIAILALKGSEALRPCGKGEPGNVG